MRSNSGSNGSENACPHDVPAPPAALGPPIPKDSSDASGELSSGAEAVSDSASHDITEATLDSVTLPLEGFVLDEPTLVNSRILPYVLMVASLIERRTIHRDELLAALRKRMRQHSIGRRPRREYVLCYLNQHPP
jgi:hypothetical protein